MPSATDTTQITARFLTAEYLVRDADNALSCPLWRSGALVAPTQSGSTVTIIDASATTIVDAAPVTVSASIARYTVPASVLPATLPLGMGWRVLWDLVVSGETPSPRRFGNSAGLVRSQLAPVITDEDLYRRRSALDPSGPAPVSTLTTYQDFIDEAWITIHGRLVNKGSLPHLIMEPTALREVHLLLTLARIYDDFKTRLTAEKWDREAKDMYQAYADAWNDLRFEYDSTDSGRSDGRRKRSGSPTVWLGGFD